MDSLLTHLNENWEVVGVFRAGGKATKPEEGCVMNGMAGALSTVLRGSINNYFIAGVQVRSYYL